MKIKHSPIACLISLTAAAAALAADPATQAPASTPSPASAVAAPAPSFTNAQFIEEYGWLMGKRDNLAMFGFTPEEIDLVIKGEVAAANGKESPYDFEKMLPSMKAFFEKKESEAMARIKQQNLAASESFFEALKANKNVVELPSGLRYEIIKPGDGSFPKATDTVKVNYTGTLMNGTEFDSSTAQGHPVEFPLNQVIPGWTEGLQKIDKGGKIRLYVPSKLAYGDMGHPPTIPPAATLIFEVELIDIKAPPPPAAASPAPAPAPAPAGK